VKVPPALEEGYKINFNTLNRACKNGDLVLVSAIRKADQKPVALVCAVNQHGGEFSVAPLAVMVEGDPFELFEDPTTLGDTIH
jgi:hypothetical protein